MTKGAGLLTLGLAIFAAAAIPAEAQLLYGGLVGNVVDAQGAVVPGASVTIVNTDTNLTRETTTDAQGAYSFANIQAGPYDVKVVLTGFKEAVRSRVPVTVGQISRVDLTLSVGDRERGGHRPVGRRAPADGQGRHPHRAEVQRDHQSPAQSVPKLSGAAGARARLDAGDAAERRDRHAGAFAERDGERPGRRRQHHAHRRHAERQRGAAAPQHLHPPGRDDRVGQHHDGQHGCRRGHGGRRGDHGHHQVGHEHLQRLGVRVLQQREAERHPLLLRTGRDPREAARSNGRRSAGPSADRSSAINCSSSGRTRATSAGRTCSPSSTCRRRRCATATSAARSTRTARSSGFTIPSAATWPRAPAASSSRTT